MTALTLFITMAIYLALITPIVAEMPLASVQDLNSNDRKYAYVVWKLSSDGKRLTLRSVNKVIPKETKDSAAVAALLTKHARNPELFGEEIEFRREK
jgi:hypothetical protein